MTISLQSDQTPSAAQPAPTDRSSYIFIFDADEDRDAIKWRSNYIIILQFVADPAVDIVDVFRLGRFGYTARFMHMEQTTHT